MLVSDLCGDSIWNHGAGSPGESDNEDPPQALNSEPSGREQQEREVPVLVSSGRPNSHCRPLSSPSPGGLGGAGSPEASLLGV